LNLAYFSLFVKRSVMVVRGYQLDGSINKISIYARNNKKLGLVLLRGDRNGIMRLALLRIHLNLTNV
jgi:hypothetical protein